MPFHTSKETLHVATFDHASNVCVLIFNFKAPVLRDIPAFEVAVEFTRGMAAVTVTMLCAS